MGLTRTTQGGEPSNIIYKAIHQETTIPFPNHLVHSVNKTHGHSKPFIQVPARTQVYGNSLFNRTIKNWNGLSETVVSASTVDILKSRLSKHLYSV